MKNKLFLLLVVTGLILSLTYAQNDIKFIQPEKAPQFNQNQLLQQLLLWLSQFTKENQLTPSPSILNPEILKGEVQSEPTPAPSMTAFLFQGNLVSVQLNNVKISRFVNDQSTKPIPRPAPLKTNELQQPAAVLMPMSIPMPNRNFYIIFDSNSKCVEVEERFNEIDVCKVLLDKKELLVAVDEAIVLTKNYQRINLNQLNIGDRVNIYGFINQGDSQFNALVIKTLVDKLTISLPPVPAPRFPSLPTPTSTGVYTNLIGYLEKQGLSITMWGSHRLISDDGRSYLIQAINDQVLEMLNRYEGKRVKLFGIVSYYPLEGGFWGIVAEKVEIVGEQSLSKPDFEITNAVIDNDSQKPNSTFYVSMKVRNNGAGFKPPTYGKYLRTTIWISNEFTSTMERGNWFYLGQVIIGQMMASEEKILTQRFIKRSAEFNYCSGQNNDHFMVRLVVNPIEDGFEESNRENNTFYLAAPRSVICRQPSQSPARPDFIITDAKVKRSSEEGYFEVLAEIQNIGQSFVSTNSQAYLNGTIWVGDETTKSYPIFFDYWGDQWKELATNEKREYFKVYARFSENSKVCQLRGTYLNFQFRINSNESRISYVFPESNLMNNVFYVNNVPKSIICGMPPAVSD